MEALRAVGRPRLGRGAGTGVRGQDLRLPNVKARTLKMTREIEAAMEDDLKTLPWMGPATKQQALEKLHSIVNKIGYPDKWRDYSYARDRARRLRGKCAPQRHFRI